MPRMKRIQVLPDYFVSLPCNTEAGVAGEVWHEYPAPKGNGATTITGRLLAYIKEATDVGARHWHIDLFMRSDIHYHSWRKIAAIVRGADADPPHYHRDLPQAIGRMLLECTPCTEPMGLTVSLYREFSFLEFGN